MPGFLGGSSSSSGTGGEITFPREFIDPVTKLRVSTPENLIDTDFEYGLQPTKWETVELINNTPSFFSKSGDTTIPNIQSVTTNSGTREITVVTSLDHGLAVGIPINVTGTKAITADGSYIINSIPNTTTFTYLCRDTQTTTASIEDLYTSIITGEFFQGSQLRIADSEGIVTNGSALSTLTVTTESTHGFGLYTPFYFLNINSTISQEFAAANTETKSFDASNSAVAQTFDGSNTLSSFNIDWSNSAVAAGVTSTITAVNTATDVITVSHGTENFSGKLIGTPLYYSVVTSSGFFSTTPRGVVFISETTSLGTSTSQFKVSEFPNGTAIDITATMTGTFQLANQARTFAGNNQNPLTETIITIVNDTAQTFDGANDQGGTGTVTSFSASLVNVSSPTVLALYSGSMVFYSTDGAAASGLTNNTTYFIDSFFSTGGSGPYTYAFTLKPLPTSSAISTISGGSGTQTFKQIGVSIDKDIIHIKNNGFVKNDMVRYNYPSGGRVQVVSFDQEKNFYFVTTIYDAHNFQINQAAPELQPLNQSNTGTNAGSAITPTTVTVIGMTAPYTFAVTSGTLPAGLSINTSTGVISGTPTAAYSQATLTITCSDSQGNTAQQFVTFQFNPIPRLYDFTSATFSSSGGGVRYGPDVATMRNNIGNPSWASQYLNMPGPYGYQYWTVPRTGTYRIVAYGAMGGHSYGWGRRGGYGARAQGDYALQINDVLKIVVAYEGDGNYYDGGGGGGSFVAKSDNTPLVAAGGGGGNAPNGGGYDAIDQEYSQGSYWGGSGGGSGGQAYSTSGGGGGFYGGGGGSWGGQSFTSGAVGGPNAQGGFGGGGGGGGTNGAGGGGGWAGGSAGPWSYCGGGGGSYFNTSAGYVGNGSKGSAEKYGQGQVTITYL